jgi:pimeloyl-ACP methyl ester carboxylesterase
VQPLFEHRMEFAGFDTRVLELEGDGPGLVLLHGWGDSADTWRPLLPELSTSPFRFELVRCPVLLVWGTRDRMFPHTGAQILLEALPHTHLELLEGVGHCPQLEATGCLLELLLPFPAAVRA